MTSFRNKYGPWAIVTGASSGIGREFAGLLAAEGLDLVLVARRGRELEALADSLRDEHGIEARPVTLDLGATDAVERLREETLDLNVGLLVNNAGMGASGPFLENNLTEELSTLDLNLRAPLALAHTHGRAMARRGHGGILFVSSTAAYQPVPWLANYSASKAHLLHFGEALAHELRPSGVDVLVASPGPTETPLLARIGDASKLPIPAMTPRVVAKQALEGLGRSDSLVTGLRNSAMAFSGRLLPRRANGWIWGQLMRRVVQAGRRGLAPAREATNTTSFQ